MTVETKSFHIGDIISITSGRLVSPTMMDGIYGILDWMTGESLMTHQLPRATRESEGQLKEDFPELASLELPEVMNSKEAVFEWLDSVVARVGSHREVRKLDPIDHTVINPISEIYMMKTRAPE